MPEQSVSCPNCGVSIPLSQAITHSIEEKLRVQFDADQRKLRQDFEAGMAAREKELAGRWTLERAALEQAARAHAADALAVRLKGLEEELAEKSRRLAESQAQELELRKGQRALEEKAAALDLELERKLATERQQILDKAREQFAEQHRLGDLVKDRKMAEMLAQIDVLKRKGEQGSQQLQGAVLETDLESLLRDSFRSDAIEAVAAGRRGGDILQRVHSDTGRPMGAILWEAKNTKAWSDAWLAKIKEDQRAEKVELAVIVSEALPRDVKRFCYREGVWITEFACAAGLAAALREQLIALGMLRQSQEGRSTKMELVYGYLAGPEFRQRVEAIVEAFVSLKEDLDAEKRALEKIWAKREKQIQRVLHTTAGMYGDFQGIVGSTLPDVESLRLPGQLRLRIAGGDTIAK